MKSIVFIIPYFGHFNNYFDIWLNSCANNPTIDWLIFTDCKDKHNYPQNVKVIYTAFNEIRGHFQKFYDFSISLEKPFKLCDFRPAYGEIFHEYIKDYDFWGYCDTDLIWGDIRKFITDDILNHYYKVGFYGHCTILKNDKATNNIYKNKYSDLPNYEQVFSSPLSFCFDEYCISEIFNRSNVKTYRLGCCFDICVNYRSFIPATSHDKNDYPKLLTSVFNYNKENLNCIYNSKSGKMLKTDVLYIHLQKRPMKILCSNFEQFSIVPNSFIEYINNWTYNLISKKAPRRLFYPHFIKLRITYIINIILGKKELRFYHYNKKQKLSKN